MEKTSPRFGPLRNSVIVNIVLPAAAIQILTRLGVSTLDAIVVSAVFPLFELVRQYRKAARWDFIAIFSIGILVLSCVLALAGGDPRLALVRESALSSAIGLVFLGSLLTKRPLIYHLSQEYMPGASARAWDERWKERPAFRATMVWLTVAWGAVLLADAVGRVVMAIVLPPSVTVIASPALAILAYGGLIVFTILYSRWAQARTQTA